MPEQQAKTVNNAVKQGQWNDYRIRCQGAHVTIWVNGLQTVDYTETDPSIPRTGIIAVQTKMHSCEEWYKDIVIRELPEK